MTTPIELRKGISHLEITIMNADKISLAGLAEHAATFSTSDGLLRHRAELKEPKKTAPTTPLPVTEPKIPDIVKGAQSYLPPGPVPTGGVFDYVPESSLQPVVLPIPDTCRASNQLKSRSKKQGRISGPSIKNNQSMDWR